MPAVFLTTPGTRASLVSERLHIEIPASNGNQDQVMRDIPLVDVEHVVVLETAHLTTAALAELMRRNISVVISATNDTILGLCLPPAPHSAVRLEQYCRAQDNSFALALAINWVEAKILNSRRVLQRLAANREQAQITADVLALSQFAELCQKAGSVDTLRGYEGTAAGRYFECYATFAYQKLSCMPGTQGLRMRQSEGTSWPKGNGDPHTITSVSPFSFLVRMDELAERQ